MYLVRFKKTFTNGFKKDGVYLFDNFNVKKLPMKEVELYPYDSIQVFNNHPNLLLIRSGGIGDLMAYSVLHNAASVTMVSQEKYRPYLNLWKTKPTFKSPIQPLFNAKSLSHLHNILGHWGRLDNSIDQIELGSRANWYDIIYEAANLPTGQKRPQLIKPITNKIDGCLIVHKSSVPNRNADLQTILDAVKPYYPSPTIASEQQWNSQQFINALASYEMVVTTDTSAVHIREGFELPAVCIYGTFDKYCRTSGHKFTKSIQSSRHCSPCQVHNKIPCKENTGEDYSPCLSGDDIKVKIQNELDKFTIVNNPTPQAPIIS